MRTVVVAVFSVIVSVFVSVPAVAQAGPCVNGTIRPGGWGGDSFLCQDRGWLHVVPNGVGDNRPDQPLPPGCVRFPDKYMCPADGPG
ncbi:hypothetical protein [Mycobacterium sp. 1081908.1]|uniref:hypothetical protein n=1 Tax=Mycobacterium sp. 1081908.1 TaxID=1834066 RepID=UPI0007FD3883|nr:hypothetical protein [Mycobacterium sp. 1081908.1]OBK49661.1 hypothetical protein A5655_01760 [Mycobacterium sp. 1081908.1]